MRQSTLISIPVLNFIRVTALLFAGAGCTTGQTGGEVETTDGGGLAEEFERCTEERSPLAPDESATLGFSAADIAALIEGTHETSLSWEAKGGIGQISLTPEAGDSTISITVAPVLDSATYVLRTVETKNSAGQETTENELAGESTSCADLIEVDADVTIQSDNGAFDDVFRATFQASSGAFATARIELEPGQLAGSFDVSMNDLPNAQASQTRLELGFFLGTVSGQISGLIEGQDGQVATGGGVEYGHFPAETCEYGYLLDGTSQWAQQLQELLEQARSFDWIWQDGEETTLGVDALLGRLCFESGGFASGANVTAVLSANVETADGRLFGHWDLTANIELDESGEISLVNVFRDAYLARLFPREDFETETGILTDSRASELSFQFGYFIEPLEDGIEASGSFAVLEVTTPECAGDVSGAEPDGAEPEAGEGEGTPGCSGSEFIERDLASFTLTE